MVFFVKSKIQIDSHIGYYAHVKILYSLTAISFSNSFAKQLQVVKSFNKL